MSVESRQKARQDAQEAETDRDTTLVARIAEGDKRAFELLFAEYGERVFRYAFRLISDASKAEEVANDVMLEVWKTAPKFEGRSKVSTWILGITRHVALNAVRRKELNTVDVDDAPEVADSSAPEPARAKDRQTLKAALQIALGKLSADHRDVVELTFFHGCSYQEIAQIVDIPENTVKTRMFHAKKQLQGLLMEQGIDPANVEMAS